MTNKYESISAWNELIGTCYESIDKFRIEQLIECIALGLVDSLPGWTIIIGGPGTGKSTLLDIICRLFPDRWTPVGPDSKDFGQYSNALAVLHDGDIKQLYENVKENWEMSEDTHFIIATNKLTEPIAATLKNEDCIEIKVTGERVSWDRYKELYDAIMNGIDELRLYFSLKAQKDFMNKVL